MDKIDLNCDMGESFGAYTMGMDESVIRHITSANVACGWHAGDPLVMDKTVKMAVDHRVGVGAHPGYPDLKGFGRRNMDCTTSEIRNYVIYQIGALRAFCRVHGILSKFWGRDRACPCPKQATTRVAPTFWKDTAKSVK